MEGDSFWRPEFLVLAGGGVKGFAHVGALTILHYWKLLENIKGIACSSVGSLIAGLWVLGYNIHEIISICYDVKIKDFENEAEMISSCLMKGYITDGKEFKKYIRNLIKVKCNDENITLLDLYQKTNIHLIFTTTCIANIETTGNNSNIKHPLVYLDHITEPTLPLYKALLMSSCFPIFFKKVKWHGHYYLDGGILNNVPTNLFPQDRTLCITFSNETSDNLKQEFKSSTIFDTFHGLRETLTLMLKIIYTMSDEIENLRIGNRKTKEINISCDASVINFNLGHNEKLQLMANGIKSALNFIIENKMQKLAQR